MGVRKYVGNRPSISHIYGISGLLSSKNKEARNKKVKKSKKGVDS